MKTYYAKSLEIQLTEEIASSGEGKVWRTNCSGYLAKIYEDPTPERISKLQAMINNPPKDPTHNQNHISIAWPCELLYQNIDCVGFVGFLMPEIKEAKELISVYHPKDRSKSIPTFDWGYLHMTARNLASIVWGLHEKNYIVGDMKPQNLLVNKQGLVSIIDTDSFQITDSATNHIYYCPVDTPEYMPPELLKENRKKIKQTKFHDYYRLAIIIHLLLFGYHPFHMGVWNGDGEPPDILTRIKEGLWLYPPNNKYKDASASIPLNVVNPEIEKLFIKCFNDGFEDPRTRPSAKEWYEALGRAIYKLQLCNQVNNHVYTLNYGKCYWCERVNQLGYDMFDAQNSNTNSLSIPLVNYWYERVNQLNEFDIFDAPNPNVSASPPPAIIPLAEKEKFNVWVPIIFLFTIVVLLFMLNRLVG